MDPLGAFMSTYTAARSSFGNGRPHDGQQFRRGSTAAGQAGTTLDSAVPTMWTGDAAEAYRTANADQRRRVSTFAELDQRVAGRIDESAAVVAAGRQNLDSVRDRVQAAAAQIPDDVNRNQRLLPIAAKGINDVATIVQQSQGDLDAIGEELNRLGKEYESLCDGCKPETEEEKQERERKQEEERLEDILERYQVADDEMNEFPSWMKRFIPEEYRNMQLTDGEVAMLATMGPFDAKDHFEIKGQAEDEATRRFPPPGDEKNTSDNHTDAFRHAYWNALMTQRFGQEWTEKFATAHERRPGEPGAREAMDLYNNEVGRRIALDNPDASPEQLADMVETAVRDGDTVVVNTAGTGVIASNDIPVGTECGHPDDISPPITDHTPYPTEGRTP